MADGIMVDWSVIKAAADWLAPCPPSSVIRAESEDGKDDSQDIPLSSVAVAVAVKCISPEPTPHFMQVTIVTALHEHDMWTAFSTNNQSESLHMSTLRH